MAVGLNPVLASAIMNSLFTGAAWPAVLPASYIQMHTGDPGVAGTANISSYATRTLINTWGTSTGGLPLVITAPVQITASWSGTNGEVIGFVSYWSAVTGGTFVSSDQLLAVVVMATGAPLNLPSLTVPFTPLAA